MLYFSLELERYPAVSRSHSSRSPQPRLAPAPSSCRVQNDLSLLECALPQSVPTTPLGSALAKTRESVSKQTTLTLLESALTGLRESHRKQRTLNPLESALRRFFDVNPLGCALPKKGGREALLDLTSLFGPHSKRRSRVGSATVLARPFSAFPQSVRDTLLNFGAKWDVLGADPGGPIPSLTLSGLRNT